MCKGTVNNWDKKNHLWYKYGHSMPRKYLGIHEFVLCTLDNLELVNQLYIYDKNKGDHMGWRQPGFFLHNKYGKKSDQTLSDVGFLPLTPQSISYSP